jgi:hypothetical protein
VRTKPALSPIRSWCTTFSTTSIRLLRAKSCFSLLVGRKLRQRKVRMSCRHTCSEYCAIIWRDMFPEDRGRVVSQIDIGCCAAVSTKFPESRKSTCSHAGTRWSPQNLVPCLSTKQDGPLSHDSDRVLEDLSNENTTPMSAIYQNVSNSCASRYAALPGNIQSRIECTLESQHLVLFNTGPCGALNVRPGILPPLSDAIPTARV